MLSLFRLTLLEILASTAWILLLVLTLVFYLAFPYIFGAYGDGIVVSRGQGASWGVFIAGIYSILLGAKAGDAQVARGANLYFRSFGISEARRWVGISAACMIPLLLNLALGGALFILNYWLWNSDLWGGVLSVAQYACLTALMFAIIIFFTVGAGCLGGYGPGVLAGIFLLGTGIFFPPLLSIAAGSMPALEAAWMLMPHFYSLDWSPSVVYLWKAAGIREFLVPLFYGFLWFVALGTAGLFFFSKSPNQHE